MMMKSVVLGCILVLLGCVAVKAQDARCLADIAFVIDHSGSITGTNDAPNSTYDNWLEVKRFLQGLAGSLDVGPDSTHVAAVGFGNSARIYFPLTKYVTTDSVRNAMNTDVVYYGGNTNTTGALRLTHQQIFNTPEDRPQAPNIVILITDGKPTYENDTVKLWADVLKNSGVTILGVGVTDEVNVEEIKRDVISEPKDELYFSVDQFDQLQTIVNTTITQACRVTAAPTTATTTTTTTTPTPNTGCTNEGDIYFVLDVSGSIGERNFDLVKQFTLDVVRQLPVDNARVRIGLILFSDTTREEFRLSRYSSRQDVLNHIQNIRYYRGTTNTASALNWLRTTGFNGGNGDRSNIPNIAVVITDGGSDQKRETLEAAYQAKKAGIHIVSMGVGDWTDEYELRNMASYPSAANYFKVMRFAELEGFRGRINDLICDNVKECRSGPCRNGGTCVDGSGTYICICPDGFAGRSCESRCRQPTDVAFALDASGSIGLQNFELQTEFVRNLVFGLNIKANSGASSRVALETFATNANIRFYLNDYNNKLAILNALTYPYTKGTTNTAAALRTMRTDLFNGGRGDRSGVPNVGIVITDGKSDDFTATWTEARNLRQAGASILTVAIGNNVRESELRAIASWPTTSNVMRARDYNQLVDTTFLNSVIDAVCNNGRECDSNPCQNGGQCFDLINGYRCGCRDGFSGIRCERRCSGRSDISFIIDASGSIRRNRFDNVLKFITDVVSQYEVGQNAARFSAIAYSESATMRFRFDQYYNKQDVISAINATRYVGGRTNTMSALDMQMDEVMRGDRGDRSDVQNYCVVVTDGGSNMNQEQTVPTAIEARIKGCHTIVLAIGVFVNELELRGIASRPVDKNLFFSDSFRDLPDFVDVLPKAMCDDVNECSSNPCRNGGQCVNMMGMFSCNCNSGWTGRRCERRCSKQLDVVFILDFSGSMEQTYNVVMAFAEEVIEGLPMRFNNARVGVVYFMDNAVNAFYLNTYQSKREVINALAFGATGGRTNSQEALRRAAQDQFTSGRGDRSGVDNVAVMVTDGGSNINRNNVENEARNLRNRDVRVFVAALGDSPDMGEVNTIASDPDSDHVVRVRNAGEVENGARILLDRLCAL